MKELICNNQLFGIVISCGAFLLAQRIHILCKKNPLTNPLLLSMLMIIVAMLALDIPLEWYQKGGDIINMLIVPATALLAVNIYNQRKVLQQNFWPVLIGCFVGSATNMAAVIGLGKLFGLDEVFIKTMLPKSVTTPIAVALSEQIGGIPSITVAAVIVTGVTGVVLGPLLMKLLRIDQPVAQGVAIGTASHVLGTSMAVEMGEIQGAMSSVSVGVCGLMAVGFALFW